MNSFKRLASSLTASAMLLTMAPAAFAAGADTSDSDPGVINNWHTHEGGQILIATDGIGYHQIEGQQVQVMHPGDVASVRPVSSTGTAAARTAALPISLSIPTRINPVWSGSTASPARNTIRLQNRSDFHEKIKTNYQFYHGSERCCS